MAGIGRLASSLASTPPILEYGTHNLSTLQRVDVNRHSDDFPARDLEI